MSIQSSINNYIQLNTASLIRSVNCPNNPQVGDLWIEDSASALDWLWEHEGGGNWVSPVQTQNFYINTSSNFRNQIITNPIENNWSIKLESLTICSLMTVNATTSNRWTFALTSFNPSNASESIISFTNTGSTANRWQRTKQAINRVLPWSNSQIIELSGTVNTTIQNIMFNASLAYRYIRTPALTGTGNLLVNGTLESGSSPWILTLGAQLNSAGKARTGVNCLGLMGSSATAQYQANGLVNGSYKLSGYARTDTPGGFYAIGAKNIGGSDTFNMNLPITTNYQLFEVTFSTSTNSALIELYGGSGNVYWDDLSLVKL